MTFADRLRKVRDGLQWLVDRAEEPASYRAQEMLAELPDADSFAVNQMDGATKLLDQLRKVVKQRDDYMGRHERVTLRLLDADVKIGELEQQRDELAERLQQNESKYVHHNETIDELLVTTRQRDELAAALNDLLLVTQEPHPDGRADWVAAVCSAQDLLKRMGMGPK